MKEKLSKYFYNNIASVIWLAILSIGFSIQFVYFLQIQFFPSFSSGSFIFLFLISCFVGIIILSAITSLLVLPSWLWKITGIPSSLTKKSIIFHFLVVLFFLEGILSIQKVTSINWFFLALGAITILILYAFTLKDAVREIKADEKGKKIRIWVTLTVITFFLPIYPLLVSLVILSTIKMPDLNIPCSDNLIILFITIVSYLINYLIISSKEWKSYTISILIVIFMILLLSPTFLTKAVAKLTRSGNYQAHLVLNKEGCKAIQAYDLFSSSIKEKGNICILETVTILSNIGNTTLIQSSGPNQERIEIKSANIISSLTYDNTKR